MIDLKPCPFCSGKATITQQVTKFKNYPIIYKIECRSNRCFINPETPTSHMLEHCAAVWNTRGKSEVVN